jgi:nucleoside-diphosphate-sugar epimerase
MKRVLVTGANGFVGSHVLEAANDYDSVQWIAACRDRRKLPAWFRGEIRAGDLRDQGYRREALRGVDVVVHTAAWTSLWSHRQESEELFLRPSMALLEDACSAGVGRLVFVSSLSAERPGRDAAWSAGEPGFWPHLSNVVRIEQRMRELASARVTMVSLRCGLFAGSRYNLGLLPVLLPRLKTRLVPWITGGRTGMPIVAGADLGQAFAGAATVSGLSGYEQFDIVGPEVPPARDVLAFLHHKYGYPLPVYSVPFGAAYGFAWLDGASRSAGALGSAGGAQRGASAGTDQAGQRARVRAAWLPPVSGLEDRGRGADRRNAHAPASGDEAGCTGRVSARGFPG